MEIKDIKSRVIAITVDVLDVKEKKVVPEARFAKDLRADSLDTVTLIMEFEREFNIYIPDDQVKNISTVGDAIKYIEEHAK